MKYALDTNTVILILRDDPSVCKKFDASVERGDEIAIPPLVHYEMLRGFLCKSAPAKENSYRLLITQYPVSGMNIDSFEHGARIYADLYQNKLTVDDIDLLIAAFCVDGGYTLVTHNTKHFGTVSGLNIEDWAN